MQEVDSSGHSSDTKHGWAPPPPRAGRTQAPRTPSSPADRAHSSIKVLMRGAPTGLGPRPHPPRPQTPASAPYPNSLKRGAPIGLGRTQMPRHRQGCEALPPPAQHVGHGADSGGSEGGAGKGHEDVGGCGNAGGRNRVRSGSCGNDSDVFPGYGSSDVWSRSEAIHILLGAPALTFAQAVADVASCGVHGLVRVLHCWVAAWWSQGRREGGL